MRTALWLAAFAVWVLVLACNGREPPLDDGELSERREHWQRNALALEDVGENLQERLETYASYSRAIDLEVLLELYRELHGDFPPALAELDELGEERWKAKNDARRQFYLIASNAAQDYGYSYKPEELRAIVVIRPKEPVDERLSFVVDLEEGLIWVGRTAGDGPQGGRMGAFPLEEVWGNITDVLEGYGGGSRDHRCMLEIRGLAEAQEAHALLTDGRYVTQFSDLLEPLPGRKLSILDPAVFQLEGPNVALDQSLGCRLRLEGDGEQWRATSDPAEEVDWHRLRFRVGSDLPLAFFSPEGEGWTPVHEVP